MTACSYGPTAPIDRTWTPPPSCPAAASKAMPADPPEPLPDEYGGVGSGLQTPSIMVFTWNDGAVAWATMVNMRSVPTPTVGAASTGTIHENLSAGPA